MIEVHRLEDMVKGWFIGNFEPSIHKTESVEVGIKKYQPGEKESGHYHKVATEFTVIIDGEVEMSGQRYVKNNILVIRPGTTTDFVAITEVTTVVVKIPGAVNDKYFD